MILMGHAGGQVGRVTWWKHFGGPLWLEVDAMYDVDLRVHDRVALDEIELYAEVLSAVAASDRPLTGEELDRVLGLPGQAPSRVPEHDVGAVVSEAERLI
jgi:hypothetical protein